MYAVGLEGGGSHTYVVIVDLEQGKIVGGKIVEKSSNRYVLGLTQALTVMHEAISETLKELNITLKDVKQVGITASGFNTSDHEIDRFFDQLGYPKFVMTHDTDGPVIAYQMQYNKPCCVLIAGTGSAAKVFVNGKHKMLSAFGHALNECGAAYSAVRRFVNRILDEFDWDDYTNKPEWEQFCKEMGIGVDHRGKDLLDLFYGNQK